MSNNFEEKRRSRRFYNEDKVDYSFTYDLVTKMKFLRRDEIGQLVLEKGHPGFVKNVSTEGLCIVSDQKLEQGETIDMEVYIPKMNEPVKMQGEVRWIKEVSSFLSEEKERSSAGCTEENSQNTRFDAGIHLNTVEGKPVVDTVYYDETYHVEWSIVLDSIIGRYRILINKKKNGEN